PFVPPAAYRPNAASGAFRFGSQQLWTVLPVNGTWKRLPDYTPDDRRFDRNHSGGGSTLSSKQAAAALAATPAAPAAGLPEHAHKAAKGLSRGFCFLEPILIS